MTNRTVTEESKTQMSKMAKLLEKEEFAPRSLSRGQIVEGLVVAKAPEQLFVDIGAKAEAIIPGKGVDKEDIDPIKEGDKVLAYVITPEGENGQAILSLRKAGNERLWQTILKKMEEGETIEVKALSANKGGLLVDYQGLRGFIPSSHLIVNPSESFGKNLQVKILEVDKRLNRLVFSEKEANPEAAKLPRIELPFSEGDIIDGVISKILPFGILVSVGSAEGLVHISEISWERVGSLNELFKVGGEVKVKVIGIDPNSGKVNLSIKQLSEDPWKLAESKYPPGKEFDAAISRTSSYGAFVQIEPGIEGLIHSSKIPYGKTLKEGDKVRVSIDLFSPEQRRVALRLVDDGEAVPKSKKSRTKEKLADQNVKETN